MNLHRTKWTGECKFLRRDARLLNTNALNRKTPYNAPKCCTGWYSTKAIIHSKSVTTCLQMLSESQTSSMCAREGKLCIAADSPKGDLRHVGLSERTHLGSWDVRRAQWSPLGLPTDSRQLKEVGDLVCHTLGA